MDSQAEDLLRREDDEYVAATLRRELTRAGPSRTELTFNVTNVVLDFVSGTATIEDELDPSVSVTVPLDDLRRYSG